MTHARGDHLVITCEHGGSAVPPAFEALFSGREGVYARQWARPSGEGGYTPVHEPLTPAVIRNHLLGTFTAGLYPIRLDGTAYLEVAHDARLDGLDYRTYVLLGDGEAAEGAVWEAAGGGLFCMSLRVRGPRVKETCFLMLIGRMSLPPVV